jgi:hypothetical protein
MIENPNPEIRKPIRRPKAEIRVLRWISLRGTRLTPSRRQIKKATHRESPGVSNSPERNTPPSQSVGFEKTLAVILQVEQKMADQTERNPWEIASTELSG